MLFLHDFTPRVAFRGEIGLAKAYTTQEIDMEMVVLNGLNKIPASATMTIEGEGIAFLTGCGLDFRLTQNIAIGAMVNMVRGSSTPESMKMEIEANGQSKTIESDDLDEEDDQDISSFGLTGGVRVLF